MAEFLLEIGLEEVPARMLARAQAELGERVKALLASERLLAPKADVKTCSTPRRLAVIVQGVQAKQRDTEETLLGPAWSIAFKGGEPAPAAHAFAKKAGIDVRELRSVATARGEYAIATVARSGRMAADLLPELLPKEIASLAWPKPMYWRPGKPERFVRPVQWMVALLDEVVVPLEFAGVRAGNQSRGHRVLHGAEPVAILVPSRYQETLLAANVMVDVEARRQVIRKALDRVTRTVPAARWREDEALVDTVTHLTEWPSVVLGSFDPAYLALPEEVLVTVMRDHQKYFAVEDANGKLLPHFLTVLNTETEEQGEAIIRHGNERVLRARFSDARFFWDFDQKTPMSDRVALLEKVTFQKDLGTYREKTERTRRIAEALATLMRDCGKPVNETALDRAATLAKVDLTSELVKEFTELQGIVGGLYMKAAASAEDVEAQLAADAVYWQYMPASGVDPIPPTVEGQILGLADRIGTIVDMFGIGLEPTGSKDPYALRRSANAIVKILAEGEVPLLLSEVALAAATQKVIGHEASFISLMMERTVFYLSEVRGFSYDVVRAVPKLYGKQHGELSIKSLIARCEALTAVRGSEDFTAIAAAWKRTQNILRQAREKSIIVGDRVNREQLAEAAEQQLYAAAEALTPKVFALTESGNYAGALSAIATLRPHVDRFFDEIMVLVEDVGLRGNRLALLQGIVTSLGKLADFSELTNTRDNAQ